MAKVKGHQDISKHLSIQSETTSLQSNANLGLGT